MIHMEIACRVMERLGLTEGREAFLLGSVAPDAVHMRPDYTVESKIHSHLFEGCGPWGDVRDNERPVPEHIRKRRKRCFQADACRRHIRSLYDGLLE